MDPIKCSKNINTSTILKINFTKNLFGKGVKCDPFLSLKTYLLQHLHLVAKKGGLIAEELGLVGQQVGHDDDDDDAISTNLVGQQVADGGDRGGELGGRI